MTERGVRSKVNDKKGSTVVGATPQPRWDLRSAVQEHYRRDSGSLRQQPGLGDTPLLAQERRVSAAGWAGPKEPLI